jgi:thiol-disulfide isomerase/thioredoxin
MRPGAFLLGLVLGLTPAWAFAEPFETNFNDQAFDWYSHAEGLDRAKAEGKLILALVKTDWCPHCKAYQEAFFDPRVTPHADHFVFVMLDRDTEEHLTSTIASDGDYVPRTMILTASGEVVEALAPHRFGEYRFLVDRPYPDELAGFLDWVVRQPAASPGEE